MVNLLVTVLLAGGQSRRMGQAKALLKLPTGQSLLDFHIEQALLLDVPIFIADNNKQFQHNFANNQQIYHIKDYQQGAGALSALVGAMIYYQQNFANANQTGYFLLSSCDSLIGVDTLWQTLNQQAKTADVIYFYDDKNQQDYPLLGLYSIDLLDKLKQRIDNGQLSVMKFLHADNINCQKIPLPQAWQQQVNFNTPIEFQQAIEKHFNNKQVI